MQALVNLLRLLVDGAAWRHDADRDAAHQLLAEVAENVGGTVPGPTGSASDDAETTVKVPLADPTAATVPAYEPPVN